MLSLFSRKVNDECSDKTTSKYLTSHSHHGYESKMLIAVFFFFFFLSKAVHLTVITGHTVKYPACLSVKTVSIERSSYVCIHVQASYNRTHMFDYI